MKKWKSLKGHWRKALIIVIILALAALAYGYIHTRNQLHDLSNPKKANQTEIQQLTDKIGKFAQLPSDETPTLATVNDVSKLKSQVFFKDAQNGDKVLIYPKAGTAVLYRPSTGKILLYSQVNFTGGQTQQ